MKWIVVVYLASVLFSYGAMNASERWNRKYRWPSLNQTWRDDSGFVIGLSLFPVLNVPASLLATNFCQNGWTLSTENLP